MGKLEGITIKEEKKQLADLIEPKIKGDKQLPLFDNQPVIEQYATEFSKRATEEQLIDINTNSNQSDTSPPAKMSMKGKHKQLQTWRCSGNRSRVVMHASDRSTWVKRFSHTQMGIQRIISQPFPDAFSQPCSLSGLGA
jgi:hypothetical protein